VSIGTKGTFDFDISIREEEEQDQLQIVQRDDERGQDWTTKIDLGRGGLFYLLIYDPLLWTACVRIIYNQDCKQCNLSSNVRTSFPGLKTLIKNQEKLHVINSLIFNCETLCLFRRLFAMKYRK
jgi:hypothetical protein